MRLGDTVLSIPTLLVAILVSAVFRELLPPSLRDSFAAAILVLSIALTGWVQYARTVRASTMVERRKEYVLAARIIGVRPGRIMRRHILPNTLTPVLVAATLESRPRDPVRGDAVVPRRRHAGRRSPRSAR